MASAPQPLALGTILDGRYRLDARAGSLTALGDYNANNVRVADSLFAVMTDPLASLGGTPLGPIGKALSDALRRAAGQFDVKGSLRLVNAPGGGAIRIESAEGAAPSGARISASGGDGVTYYWPSGRLRIDGNFQTGGGGLHRRPAKGSIPIRRRWPWRMNQA